MVRTDSQSHDRKHFSGSGSYGKSRHHTRFRCPVIFVLTVANAVAAIVSVFTKGGSNWADPAKIVCYAIWNATGCAGILLFMGWMLLYLHELRGRRDLSFRIGCSVAAVHGLIWLLAPSWS